MQLKLTLILLFLYNDLLSQDIFNPQSVFNSVVRIEAIFSEEKYNSSGFAIGEDAIVTTLHSVANANHVNVYSATNGSSSKALVIYKNCTADLAILRLEKHIGLDALPKKYLDIDQTYQGDLTVFGHPLGIFSAQGDPIRLSITSDRTYQLYEIFQPENDYEQKIIDQGFPELGINILRVNDIISPGLSGSPLIDNRGNLVGIANGGLRQGIARVNWFVPIKYLFEGDYWKEENNNCNVNNIDKSIQVQMSTEIEVVSSEFIKTSEIPLGQLIVTSLDNRLLVQRVYDEMNHDILETERFMNLIMSIYEDRKSGHSIALPNSLPLTIRKRTNGIYEFQLTHDHGEGISLFYSRKGNRNDQLLRRINNSAARKYNVSERSLNSSDILNQRNKFTYFRDKKDGIQFAWETELLSDSETGISTVLGYAGVEVKLSQERLFFAVFEQKERFPDINYKLLSNILVELASGPIN